MFLVTKWLVSLYAGAGIIVGLVLDPYVSGRSKVWETPHSAVVLLTLLAIAGNMVMWRTALRSATPGGDALDRYLRPIATIACFLICAVGMFFL